LVAHKAAPAMAVGNPIIIKPSTKTPLTALILGEIIMEAGWPDGAVNVIVSSGKEMEKAVSDPRIKKLTFTGSAEVGWMLKKLAFDKKVTLELGGNAACIIHDDAYIDFAAMRCVVGAFSFAGQVCISVQRIFVKDTVFDEFAERFVATARSLKPGDPLDETTDVGPMIDDDSIRETQSRVREAIEKGAKVLLGNGFEGRLHEPTVLTNTTPEMRVNSEETFAPVVTIERYERFESALDMANNSIFGLQAGVFTKDIKRIFEAYSRLDAGAVIINDIPMYRTENMPYGGVKSSGFGREGVRYAMEEMTEMRLLVVNLNP
ncbi:MAG: aldehyde dehydrogenase family protein, partial [Deltaproteobacteria bacterium]|nr:aldehyde dehydrogenase family protein [Deltaproteobacteria bacterium]